MYDVALNAQSNRLVTNLDEDQSRAYGEFRTFSLPIACHMKTSYQTIGKLWNFRKEKIPTCQPDIYLTIPIRRLN